MTRFLAALALALTAALASPAMAETACPQFFLDGQPPVLSQPVDGALELCNDGYALLYDPRARILVYSVEHLTTTSLDAGADIERANSFKADPRLKPEQSAHPADYAGRPYDRGHMSPDHDMPTTEAKWQSDYLDNVVPQNRVLNRGLWARIEARGVRGSVIAGLDGYVATGPILTPAPEQRVARPLNGRIPVPPRIFKAFWRPADAKGRSFVGAWVVRNEAKAQLEVWSLDKLAQEIGRDVFPSLSAVDHARADLPEISSN